MNKLRKILARIRVMKYITEQNGRAEAYHICKDLNVKWSEIQMAVASLVEEELLIRQGHAYYLTQKGRNYEH